MRPTFEKTVDILVKAYLNDTLEHKICGCAVHNIIESLEGREVEPLWIHVFVTVVHGGRCYHPENYTGEIKDQIDNTGYTVHQLADMEYAFERDRHTKDIFGCLMNVVDVLAEIHNVSLDVREESKKLFVKI